MPGRHTDRDGDGVADYAEAHPYVAPERTPRGALAEHLAVHDPGPQHPDQLDAHTRSFLADHELVEQNPGWQYPTEPENLP